MNQRRHWIVLVDHCWTLLLLVNWVCWLQPLNWHVCFVFSLNDVCKFVLISKAHLRFTDIYISLPFAWSSLFFWCCFCSSQTVDPFGPTPRACHGSVHVVVRGLSRGGCRPWPREDEDRGRARGLRHGSFHSHVRRAAERQALMDGRSSTKMIKKTVRKYGRF